MSPVRSALEWFEAGTAAARASSAAEYGSEMTTGLEEAIAAFDQVLALEPTHLGALKERGFAQAQLNMHEEALASFVAASSQVPGDAGLRLAVAQSLMQLGKFEAACAAYDDVMRLRPGDEVALLGRAEVLMALRRDELAVADWDAFLSTPRVGSLRLRARLSRALALGRLDRAEAQQAFREVFDSDSIRLAGPMAPRVFHEALRELEVARAAYRAHLEANAGDERGWKVMGRDTFAREDFVVGEFPSKAEAEARIAELEARAASRGEALRERYWLVPA